MKIADGSPLEETPCSGKLMLLLLLSCLIHLLFFWLASHFIDESDPQRRTKPRTLHLKLSPAPVDASESETEKRSAGEGMDRPAEKASKPTSGPAPTSQQPNPESPAENAPRNSLPSSAAIIATAKASAKEQAQRDQSAAKPRKNRVESILARAFNKGREQPGVKQLADGRIRVVTEQGLVYCVRATEDWRFHGPEEDLPMNTTCN